MLIDHSIKELSNLLKKKEISSVDLVKESYSRIEEFDLKLHSFITIKDKTIALKEAEEKDKNIKNNSSIVYGLPFAVKDAYVTKDLRTTAGSKILNDYYSPYNATVVEKIAKAGAILIGKNNMDNWGHGASNENTNYQIPHNPWDMERITGGSSGGSAVAVSTRMVPFAIGEDTGGSIRNPSSMCDISGLKVTYGRVSRYGAIAYASSLDTVGPMAKSVEDLSYLLEIMAGYDDHDSTSSTQKVENYHKYLEKSIKGKVIGLPKEFFGAGLDPEIKKTVLTAIKIFEKLGAKIQEVSLPHFVYGVSIYYLIALSETSSNLGRYDSFRYGDKRELFSNESIRRILLGTYALSAGYADKLYKKAQKLRTILIQEYETALKTCDVLLGPVTPSLPSKIGEMISDPVKNLLEDLYTGTVNLIGAPALAIPAGFSEENLPIGFQVVGKKFGEGELFQFGYLYQQETDWHKKLPPIIQNVKD
ncbi:MAG: Glutamyl-tRNA(Gln) amidotransferase subunit A [Candidatus Roizmanbacteria bacterium GW2011_GWC2_34_23]|uniref:Glutamyl-tRNA(Gln) amidotransferase subunit A n=1 Tax=Candidatus Roizmanbacteria bacterium GW2011_GWC2_34_23 TaxID=1618484 RepID=A0A0G0ASU8_9BACT|nr:MAG: Glutamyl-tRNA(Gln) amidotransferase subunit A [Candidatus Roizmanbacteria bacterium GW2011_GWC2_34_23]